MKAEQEHQWKKSQQTQPEPGETSGEGLSTSVLKVKSQKGKTVKIVQVEEDKPVEKKSDKSRRNKKRLKTKVTNAVIEFEDQMYKLMQETEMMTEYQEMTSEWEEELSLTANTEGESQIPRNERILPVTGKRDRARNGAEVS